MAATIVDMAKASQNAGARHQAQSKSGPFVRGCVVVVTLGNPRDKFWGMILSLAAEGLSIGGIELASFEDLVAMVKDGEPFTPAVVFFPMHRIERIELDLPDGSLPSLSQRFSAKTGLEPGAVLGALGEWRGGSRRATLGSTELGSTEVSSTKTSSKKVSSTKDGA